MTGLRDSLEKSKFGPWVGLGRTYQEERVPDYQLVDTLMDHESANTEYLGLFDKMMRAGAAEPELDGSTPDDRPYHLVAPGYIVSAASRQVYFSAGKSFGNILEGELGMSARPEDIRINAMTIINPAVLDGVPSTAVTPIPFLLMAFANVDTLRTTKSLYEAAMMIKTGKKS